MSNWKLLAGVAATSIMTAAIVAPAEAQVTTSEIRGTVTTEAGGPVSGATVTVTDTATGLTRSTMTGATGNYGIRNLPLSSAYSVIVTAADLQGQQVENIALFLGDTTNLDFTLTADADRMLDTVVVTASAAGLVQTAVGPNATFDIQTLETAPASNRSISDVLRFDPRIYVDESQGNINPVQCGGKNPRFNSLTLDGVRLNDGFGLNDNGFPTERQPFPFDAIEQVAVELAPFDVEYGGFTACNINAVTKSGTNEFSGSLFYDYTSDDFRGDSLEGDSIQLTPFDEARYGVQVAGPIIKDKLFFSVAYEKLEGTNTFDRGPEGSGAVNEVSGLTQDQIDEILDIARTVYQYDPGEIPSSADNEDEKLLIKLDWNINDKHRANFTYNYNDGFNITESDGDPDEFEFSNHLYERGAELNQYVGSLYSDWTPNFSTEFRVGQVELENRQISVGGTDFGEITIETGDVDIYLGGDDSRSRNQLSYDIFQIAAKGFYQWNDHSITFGWEREEFDVFNVFVANNQTEIDFENISLYDVNTWTDTDGDGRIERGEADLFATYSAIDAFRLGFAENIAYNNAPSLNPDDAAAIWGYATDTFYIQDEYQVNDKLSVIAGLRYDLWSTDDEPETNADFLADYGFSNNGTIDGESLLQPRLAFTYDAADNLTVRGGVGLYSGGDPNVWISNNYNNNNVLQFGADGSQIGLEIREDNVAIDPNTQTIEEAIAAASTSIFDPSVAYTLCEEGVPVEGPGWCIQQGLVDAVAAGMGSNFEINALDPNFKIPSEWKFALGATWIPTLNVDNWLGGEYVVNADLLVSKGQDSAIILRGDLEQTRTDANGYPVYVSVREPAFILQNADDGNEATTVSFSVAKDYDNGFDWAFGYAWNDSKEIQPMTSAIAFSNYNNRAVADPQAQNLATSDFNIQHRFTLVANYEKAFFGDYLTTFSAFATARSGLPYSLAGGDSDGDEGNFSDDRDFFADVEVLQLGTLRNSEESDWWTKVDLRVEQEFPGLRPNDRSSAFVIIDNLTNLINEDWGILEEPGFPPIDEFSRVGDASLWQIRLGIRYEF